MTQLSEEQQERLEQIRERIAACDAGASYGYHHLDLFSDLRFTVSLLDGNSRAIGEQWFPIENAPRDEALLLFAPKERLYSKETIEAQPDLALDEMKVARPRDWTWATHWQRVHPPESNDEH